MGRDVHPNWNETRRVPAAEPLPAVEAAEEFARTLRDEWPVDEDPKIEGVQLEATEPISELAPASPMLACGGSRTSARRIC